MKARTMIAVAVMSLATLAAATAVQAGHGKAEPRLNRLAFEVEKSAHRVSKDAERHAYRWSYGEEQALRRLQELDRSARIFRETLERYGPYRERTESAFVRLNDAAWSVRRVLPGTHAFRKNPREFQRLAYLVQDLREEYRVRLARARPGPQRHPHGGPPGHGAYVRIDAKTARGHATFRHGWDD
jgi:hypothetical protein